MRMVPPTDSFRSIHSLAIVKMVDEIFVCISCGVNSCFCALDGQTDRVHNIKGISHDLALHHAHDFEVATGFSMHDHFDEGSGRDFNFLEEVFTK